MNRDHCGPSNTRRVVGVLPTREHFAPAKPPSRSVSAAATGRLITQHQYCCCHDEGSVRVRVAVHISTYNRRHRNCRRQAPSRRHGCGALVPLMQRTLGSDMALNGSAAANGVEVICSTVHGGDSPLLPAKIFRERPLRFGSGEKLNQKSLAAPLFTMSRKEVDGWEGKSCSFVTKRRTTQYDMHIRTTNNYFWC